MPDIFAENAGDFWFRLQVEKFSLVINLLFWLSNCCQLLGAMLNNVE